MFMGKSQENFDKVKFLALSNLDEKILFSRNENLNKIILHKFKYENVNKDVFVVIRAENYLNQIDR